MIIKALAEMALHYTRLENEATARGDLEAYREYTFLADDAVYYALRLGESELFWHEYHDLIEEEKNNV